MDEQVKFSVERTLTNVDNKNVVQSFSDLCSRFYAMQSMKQTLYILGLLSFIFIYHLAFIQITIPTISSPQIWSENRISDFSLDKKYSHENISSSPKCWMIVRYSDGRFGNRMFLFASAYGLARLHQCHLYVDPSIIAELRTVFNVNLSRMPIHFIANGSEFENRTDIYSRFSICTLFPDIFRVPLDRKYLRYELTGFYQAYGYFDRYREEIAQLFEFKEDILETLRPLVDQLVKNIWNDSISLSNQKKEDKRTFAQLKMILRSPPISQSLITWIGVHIRRTDFSSFFGIQTSTSYIQWGIDYYRTKYPNSRFLVASDDKIYARNFFNNQSDVIILPSSFNRGSDLAAMSLCDHSLLTAGTYGWWAAWLTAGDVVHDLNYPPRFINCIREYYFPPWFLFPQNSSSQLSTKD